MRTSRHSDVKALAGRESESGIDCSLSAKSGCSLASPDRRICVANGQSSQSRIAEIPNLWPVRTSGENQIPQGILFEQWNKTRKGITVKNFCFANASVQFAALALLLLATTAQAQQVTNASFETPAVTSNTDSLRPTGATWSFAGQSGIRNNNAPNGSVGRVSLRRTSKWQQQLRRRHAEFELRARHLLYSLRRSCQDAVGSTTTA
jgi:hypothetical protein